MPHKNMAADNSKRPSLPGREVQIITEGEANKAIQKTRKEALGIVCLSKDESRYSPNQAIKAKEKKTRM